MNWECDLPPICKKKPNKQTNKQKTGNNFTFYRSVIYARLILFSTNMCNVNKNLSDNR